MGLDVHGYKSVRLACPSIVLKDEDGYPRDEHVRFYKHPAFPDQYDGLIEYGYYAGDYVDGPSMSYGYYGRWREQLAKLAGYPMEPYDLGDEVRVTYCAACWSGAKGPFSEQINFSDCEGTFGPTTTLKLSLDYIAFDEKAKTFGDEFYRVYTKFRNVFEKVSGNGVVKFG